MREWEAGHLSEIMNRARAALRSRVEGGLLGAGWFGRSRSAAAWCLIAWLLAAAHAAVFYWVCDDAFISFRYAQQLLDGNGLVFNAGERVEGYTNLLWVLEVALLNAIGMPMSIASIALSVLATAGTFWIVMDLARSTPFASMRGLAVAAALLSLALNRNVAIWTTSGLETRQFSFFVLLAAWLARRALAGKGSWLAVSLVLGATELTRPEGTLIAASIGAWALYELARGRGPRLRPLLELTLPCAAIVGVHYVWRYAYYGDWLPNTAYAKVVRPWPDAGILYYGAAAIQSGLYLVVPLAAAGGFLRRVRNGDPLLALGAFILLPHVLYVVIVGGDHFEFRPLDFYWPLLAVGVGDAFSGFGLWLRLRVRRARLWQPRALSLLGWSSAFAVLCVYSTALQVAQFVAEYPRRSSHDLSTAPPVQLALATSFPIGQALPFFGALTGAYEATMRELTSHAIGIAWGQHQAFESMLIKQYKAYASEERELLPDGAVMLHSWMGVIPFHLREVSVIDRFGLTDRTIARHGTPSNERRTMAHDRSPPPGYLETRGINIAVEAAAASLGAALEQAPYAVRLAPGLWAPFSSSRPDWVETAFGSRPWYHIDWRRPERSVLDGRNVRSVQRLLDCEAQPVAWSMGAARCTDRTAKNEAPVSGEVGAWLSTYGPKNGDQLVTEARSPAFVAATSTFLIFALGGGSGPDVRVVLRGTSGEELSSAHGQNDQRLRPVLVDLAPYAGQELRLELVDQADGGWGHLLLDNVAVVTLEGAAASAALKAD
jgi:arabinofuranosyltransferase